MRQEMHRGHADRCLYVFLDLSGLREAPQAQAGRLLRVLQLWLGVVPACAAGAGLLHLM